MDTDTGTGTGTGTETAEADAAMINGHEPVIVLMRSTSRTAEADAAMINGHPALPKFFRFRAKDRGGRRGDDQWTQMKSLYRTNFAQAAMINANLILTNCAESPTTNCRLSSARIVQRFSNNFPMRFN